MKTRTMLPVAALCCLLLPVAGWSKNGGAVGVLQPHGNVTVNGQVVTQTTTLFPGDVVSCGKGSVASIVRAGSITQVPEESIASFQNGKAQLARSRKHSQEESEFRDEHRSDEKQDQCRPISPHSPKHHSYHHNDCDKD